MKAIKRESRLLFLVKCRHGYIAVVYRGFSLEDIAFTLSHSLDDVASTIASMKSYGEIRYGIASLTECTALSRLGIECIMGSRMLEYMLAYRESLDRLCRLLDRLYDSIAYGVYIGNVSLI